MGWKRVDPIRESGVCVSVESESKAGGRGAEVFLCAST